MGVAYRIKPLVWVRARADDLDGEWWQCSCVFGSYHADRDEDGVFRWRYCFDEYYDEGSYECESIDAGKQAAEQHYRERLAPALEPVSPGR